MSQYDLENRLIAFSVEVIRLTKSLNKSFENEHLSRQIIRSATSAPLNYGEAQSAESRRDFIHKLKIILKELRETLVCLKILSELNKKQSNSIANLLSENNQLISIFMKSVQTTKRNSNDKKKPKRRMKNIECRTTNSCPSLI